MTSGEAGLRKPDTGAARGCGCVGGSGPPSRLPTLRPQRTWRRGEGCSRAPGPSPCPDRPAPSRPGPEVARWSRPAALSCSPRADRPAGEAPGGRAGSPLAATSAWACSSPRTTGRADRHPGSAFGSPGRGARGGRGKVRTGSPDTLSGDPAMRDANSRLASAPLLPVTPPAPRPPLRFSSAPRSRRAWLPRGAAN